MDLKTWADISAVLTCVFVMVGYLKYQIGLFRKSKKLEHYLKSEAPTKHTAIHLVRHIGLTEEEIIKISFRNKHVGRFDKPAAGPGTLAEILLFGYVP